jgi:hypothetical protein
MPIITEGRRSQLVPDGDDATDGFSLHFAHHDYAAADGFNSRRMEMQPARMGGEAFLRGWAWSMRAWTKPTPAWRNTASLPARHHDCCVHDGAGEEGREFSGFLNLRKIERSPQAIGTQQWYHRVDRANRALNKVIAVEGSNDGMPRRERVQGIGRNKRLCLRFAFFKGSFALFLLLDFF